MTTSTGPEPSATRALGSPAPRCCSDWKIDTYLADELSAEDGAAMTRHLEQSAPCRVRVDELRQKLLDFAASAPPLSVPSFSSVSSVAALPKPQLSAVARAHPLRNPRFVSMFAGLSAAAALVFVLLREPASDETATKGFEGGASLIVYAHDGQSARALDDLSVVHPGEVLRFVVRASGTAYVAVIGRDGSGTVAPYAPLGGPAIAVSGGMATTLDGAIELDGLLGDEALSLWICRAPVSTEALVAAAREGRAREGCSITRSTLHKVAR